MREISEAVARIRKSNLLGSGGRLEALLDYLVDEELAGRGDRLNAYAIAFDVFNRGDDFDPSIDSLVRVEMLRLRKALALYYATQEPNPKLEICFPKRSYRPAFVTHEAKEEGSTEDEEEDGASSGDKSSPRWGSGGRSVRWTGLRGLLEPRWIALAATACLLLIVGVVSFIGLRAGDGCSRPTLELRIADGYANKSIMLRSAFNSLLRGYPLIRPASEYKGCDALHHVLAIEPAAADDGRTALRATLYGTESEAPHWTDLVPLAVAGADQALEQAMAELMYDLASPEGMLVQHVMSQSWPEARLKEDFACHLSVDSYFINRATDDPADELNCLERSMMAGSPYADTYSNYALLVQRKLVNDDEFGDYGPDDPKTAYVRAMVRSGDIDPLDPGRLIARLREYRRTRPIDYDRLSATIRRIEQYYEYDPLLLNQTAVVEGFYFGNWEKSQNHINRAIAISGPLPRFQYAEISNLMIRDKWQEAYDRLRIRHTVVIPVGGIMLVAAGAQASDEAMIQRGRSYLAEKSILTLSDAARYLEERQFHRSIVTALLGAMEGAMPA